MSAAVESEQALVVASPAASDVGKENRDRWHWTEVDLEKWVKKWAEVNLDERVLFEDDDVKFRTRNSYKDNEGEVLLHARKEKVFATYNFDLVVKWYAQRRFQGRVLGESRGRVRVAEVSSESVTPRGEPKDEDSAVYRLEGDWEYGRGVNNALPPGATLGEGELEQKYENETSEAERELKHAFEERGLPAVKSLVAALHIALADLAAAREADPGCALPEPTKLPLFDSEAERRARKSTAELVESIKAKLRPPEFEERLATLADLPLGNFRCMSLGDADVALIVEKLTKETKLTKLDLSYNDGITDVGLQGLICKLACGAAPHLTELDLEQTKISQMGQKQLMGLTAIRRKIQLKLPPA